MHENDYTLSSFATGDVPKEKIKVGRLVGEPKRGEPIYSPRHPALDQGMFRKGAACARDL